MIFVVSGGSGGGLPAGRPIIHVTTPAGSSVTLAKSGTSIAIPASQKRTNGADAALEDWYYSIPSPSSSETWTVSAAKTGETTASATITVASGSKKWYDVVLSYNLDIIKAGNVISPFAAAVLPGYTEGGKSGSYYRIHQLTGTASRGGVATFGPIPETTKQYTSLVCEFYNLKLPSSSYRVYLGVASKSADIQPFEKPSTNVSKKGESASPFTLTLDVSGITLEGLYPAIWFTEGNNDYSECNISKMYLN